MRKHLHALWEEFKGFALRGNAVDLGVGVLIATAFSAVVRSFSDNILTPILSLFGGMDLSEMMWTINGVNIKYGAFVAALVNFLLMAFLVFLSVKAISRLRTLTKQPK